MPFRIDISIGSPSLPLAEAPHSDRLVAGAWNARQNRMLMVRLGGETGKRFREVRKVARAPGLSGIDFRRTAWAQGDSAEAHGLAVLFQCRLEADATVRIAQSGAVFLTYETAFLMAGQGW
jgi:hypothetical protein